MPCKTSALRHWRVSGCLPATLSWTRCLACQLVFDGRFRPHGIPGLLLGGWLADWAVRRRDDGRLRWGAFLIFLAVPGWLVALQQPAGQVVPFTIAMGCACGLMYFYYSAVYPTLQDIVTPICVERPWHSTSVQCTCWVLRSARGWLA